MANRFAEQIEAILTPLVGEFVAKMAVKSQCKSLGIAPEDIGVQHLEPLSKKIGAALAFHGKDAESQVIITKIRSMR